MLQWLVLAAPVVAFTAAGWAHRWITEDGFIYLRVVHQIGAGHGPVFNAGQRVEAYTGALWVGILALADLLTPIRLEWIAVFLGIGFGATGVALAIAGARRLWSSEEGEFFVPFGAVVFVAIFPIWVYATSGLETGLVFGWLGTCLWILSGWARSPDHRLSTFGAVVLGLGWLIRPELIIFSAAFFVLVLAFEPNAPRRRARVRVAVAMLALPVGYQIFRMGFFGSLLPNTAIAKDSSSTNWSRGWTYLRDFADPYWLWVPAAAMVAGGYFPLARHARERARVLWVAGVFVACGALQTMYVVAVGGDYLHARLLLPAFFAVCAPVAAIPAARRHAVALVVVPWVLAAIFGLRPTQYTSHNLLAHLIEMPAPSSFGKVTTEDWGWGRGGREASWYTGPAYYFEDQSGLKYTRVDIPVASGIHLPVGAFWGVGLSAYSVGTGFRVLDLEGLADSFTAHLQSTPSRLTIPRFPGHAKPVPAPWIAAMLTPAGTHPPARDFPVIGNPLIPPTTGRAFQEQVAWARAALRCGNVQRIVAAADAPMTPTRFVANFVHSVGNTRTRIPPDPETAYHRFCGAGTPAEVRALRD